MKTKGIIAILVLMVSISFPVFANKAEAEELVGGCMIGASATINKFAEGAEFTLDRLKSNCIELLKKNISTAAKQESKYQFGCGLGVGAAFREIHGPEETAKLIASDSKLTELVIEMCSSEKKSKPLAFESNKV